MTKLSFGNYTYSIYMDRLLGTSDLKRLLLNQPETREDHLVKRSNLWISYFVTQDSRPVCTVMNLLLGVVLRNSFPNVK